MSIKQDKIKIIFSIFAASLIFISAVFTFSFFYTWLPAIIPPILGDKASAPLSGALGVFLFDGGAMIFIYTYLYNCENNKQRIITLSASVFDFLGSAVASFTQVIMVGAGIVSLGDTPGTLINVPDHIIDKMGWSVVFVVALAVVLNFGAIWLYARSSNAAIEAIRDADRQARIDAARAQEQDYLDGLIVEQTKEQLHSIAAELAHNRARQLKQTYQEEEGIAIGGTLTPTLPPIAEPLPTIAAATSPPDNKRPELRPLDNQGGETANP